PDVFCCALLNAQPMGFYAPAQIVRDARDHGIEIRPVDVNRSRWDSTLEPVGDRHLAVRLGLRMAKGLSEADGVAIVLKRGEHPYATIEDLSRRAGVPTAALERLAEADAFRSMGAERRDAIWAIRALRDITLPLFATSENIVEQTIALAPMRPGRTVVEDYGSVGLSLRQHPIAFVREDLARQGMTTCAELEQLHDGRRVIVPGLVLVRQKPGSAKGVMFITLEDETGIANLIVWPSIFERQRRLVLTSSMMAAHGKVQKESGVTHVIVEKLVDLSGLLRQVGERDEPVILPTGRGDEARHGGSPDVRQKPVHKPRDIYSPERLSNGIKVQTRDFR
ncbi:MAG: OB-fold nucleic acid binding domain-containing protein, partial [Pseudomonadota bacterium]|nr:OB-fold nucleic acid binding domain-containing protein [Pseudomonadota bacterium]